MRATAIVLPTDQAAGPSVRTAREFDAVDEFASSVGKRIGQEVPILEIPLSAAPAEGYLLVFGDRDLSDYAMLGSRIILINADRSTVANKLERFGLAGAIEKHRYFQWKTARSLEDGSGVIGLKHVAPRISAEVTSGPYTTQKYGWFMSPSSPDLASLLADYLKALGPVE